MPAIRLAVSADFPALANFIEVQNTPLQCIHSSTGEGAENLLVEIEKLAAVNEIIYVLAEERGQFLGVMGCEFAVSEHRGWVRGPLIHEPSEPVSTLVDFATLAWGLYDTLIPTLPPEITILDTFLHVGNLRGQAFYQSVGFSRRSRHHVYVAERPEHVNSPCMVCLPMPQTQLNVVRTLHNTVFPGIRTGEDVLQGLDDDHRVWVYAPEEEVLGYVFAVIEPWADGGYVEFLGVRENARGQGIGAALLATALYWCFAERNVSEVGLTVDDKNVNARGLYERAGFRLKYSGVNQRLERGSHD